MSQPNTYSVTITGFKTKEDVEQFVAWYSHMGEQDCSYWMEVRRSEGMNISPDNCFYLASYKTLDNQWQDNTCCVELLKQHGNSNDSETN